MKKLLSFLFLFCFLSSFSQQQKLSLDDAVLGYYKGYYPTSLYNKHWVKDTETYVYQNENNLVFTNATTNLQTNTISFETLQKTYNTLKRFPNLEEITASTFSFTNDNATEIYNYVKNTKEASIIFDENAQNNDYNSKANAVAYTLANNLYIATTLNKKVAVTTNEDTNIVSGQAIHRSEFGIYKGTFWSPKGNFLAFLSKG